MMRYLIILLYFTVQVHLSAQKFLNLGFENTLSNGVVTSWGFYPNSPFFKIKTDTIVHSEGKNSLSIERTMDSPKYVARYGAVAIVVDTDITKYIKKKTIKLVAWVKADTNDIKKTSLSIILFGHKTFDSTSHSLITLDKDVGLYHLESEAPLDSLEKVKRITINLIFAGSKKVWFDDIKIYIDGIQLKDGSPPKDTTLALTPPQYKRLNNHISIIDTNDSSTNFKDLEKALKPFMKAKIIGLGEATHGTKEFNQNRRRMIQYLVQNKSYDFIVFEGGIFEMKRLNNYVQDSNSKEDLKSLMNETVFGVWNTTEVYELIKWVQNYNKASPRKIKFIGMDIGRSSGIALKQLDDWASKSKDTLAAFMLKQFKDFEKNKQYDLLDSIIDQISELYKNNKPVDKDAWQGFEFSLLKQSVKYKKYNALSPRQFNVLAEKFRDSCMAANLTWYKNQNTQSKFIIWAHNAHISKGKTALGHFLSKQYRDEYVSVALTTASGTYTGYFSLVGKWYKSDLVEPYNGTWENALASLKYDNFILHFNKKYKAEFMSYSFKSRDIGAAITEYQFSNIYDLKNDFDAVIFFKKTTASENFYLKN
jgi:erythromycin esterase